MGAKGKALTLNIIATLFYAFTLFIWYIFSLMGLMSVANADSIFEVLIMIYIFLLLLLPNILISQFMSWRFYLKGVYSKSYKWMLPPLVHIILFIILFNVAVYFE